MIKTVLIVIALSLSHPELPAMIIHQSYPSAEACAVASVKIKAEPREAIDVRTFCISASDLESN